MASPEDIQIAKDLMVAILSSDKAQPSVLFAPTTVQGHRFVFPRGNGKGCRHKGDGPQPGIN